MIIDLWDPFFGGGQKHVWEISKRLVRQYKCEVHIFTRQLKDENGKKFKKDKSFFNGKLRVIRCFPCTREYNVIGRVLSMPIFIYKILKFHHKYKYDLLHGHSYLGAIPLKVAGFFTNLKTIYTVHSLSFHEVGKRGLLFFLENMFLFRWRYDLIISVSEIFNKYKSMKRGMLLIPNGVDSEKFDSIISERKNSIFKIIFVGRFFWEKNLPCLIEAVNIMNQINSSLILDKKMQVHLIGSGQEENICKKLVNHYKLNDLFFFRGKIFGDNLIKEYKSSKLFVLPSISEGDPLVIKEAWAAKLPIVATRCGSCEDLIKEGINGFLVEKQNAQTLAKRLLYVLKMSDEELLKIGENGYHLVKNKYDWNNITKQTMDIYLKLIFDNVCNV